VKNNPVKFTDPTGLIAKTLSGGHFTTITAAAPAAPKLDAPPISMPKAAVEMLLLSHGIFLRELLSPFKLKIWLEC
jgi:hypothetical protein